MNTKKPIADSKTPTVTFIDYSTKITVKGKPAKLANCPNCGSAPHAELSNGKKICGFCGLEH
jgi:ribosomal protein S27AE